MTQFGQQGQELVIGGQPVTQLAARIGTTPFYAYDRQVIATGIEQLKQALPSSIKLHYAMKANPMPAVVAHLTSLVDGIDVASAGELQVALDAGANPQEISFAGPGKTAQELRQAVAAGIMVNIESFREVPLLARASTELGLPARVSVRVNPDFELKSSGMKMAGGPKQFGVDAEQVPQLLGVIGEHGLAFEGFHLFAGSQNLRPESIVEAQRKCFDLAVELSCSAPSPVRFLNLGGGFGIPYFPGDKRLDLTSISENLDTIVAEANNVFKGADIVLELGRYMVGEAGVYVCEILDRKESRGHTFLVTNGGLHHHLAASGNFGQIIRRNYPVCVGNRMKPLDGQQAEANETETVSVVGPLCTPLDLLGDKIQLPKSQVGDLIVLFQSGAYGLSSSPQRFLGHPEILEVLV
nr:L-glutamyl-[BtrI acyl-carrier protein] decarboxylase-like [Nerophis lumbriciformis]